MFFEHAPNCDRQASFEALGPDGPIKLCPTHARGFDKMTTSGSRARRLPKAITVALFVAIMTGCNSFGWSLPAPLRTTSNAASMPAEDWRTHVTFSTGLWNAALGCAPFVVDDSPDAHAVNYIAFDSWKHGNDAGLYLDDEDERSIDGLGRIEIRERVDGSATTGILLHELGHALGLSHEDDSSSIMNAHPSVNRPSADDIARAKNLGVCS